MPPLPHHTPEPTARFRCYAELNDFLPPGRRQRDFTHRFRGTPSVKETIEALGVPHTEIDLILVDGVSVGFDHLLRGGERVAVYPVFESFDVGPVQRLHPRPLRDPRFVVDENLGRLARYLRLLGFDTLYQPGLRDHEVVALSVRQRRILLTRDRGMLMHGQLTHGYWVRHDRPREQLREVAGRLQLAGPARPFSRCSRCNTPIEPLARSALPDSVPPRVRQSAARFHRCPGCRHVYWDGSHCDRIRELIATCVAPTGSRRADGL